MDIKIKSMTRGQIKALRKAGYDLALAKENRTEENSVAAMEWIFDNVYPELAKDENIPYDEMLRIATATYAKTYGKEPELKY